MSSPSGRRPQRGGEAFPFFSSCPFAHGPEGAWRRLVPPSDSGAPIEVRPSVPRAQRGARPTFGSEFGLPVEALRFGCEGRRHPVRRPCPSVLAGGRNEGFSSIPLKTCEPLGIVTEVGSPVCRLCRTEQRWRWPSRPEGARLVGPAGTEGAICDAALPCALVGGLNEGERFALTWFVLSTPLP